jgi:hypothetical protein
LGQSFDDVRGLAGWGGAIDGCARKPSLRRRNQTGQIASHVPSLAEEYGDHPNPVDAQGNEFADGPVQVRSHQLQITEPDFGFGREHAYPLLQTFEGLGPARVACAMRKKDQAVSHRQGGLLCQSAIN